MRVLIVDDSEVLVQRLAFSLTSVPGIQVIGSAGNVADAVLRIREAKPDVVILDIAMPGGSGIDVLEVLKHDSAPPIVIILSNYSNRQYRSRCLGTGARYYFDKSDEFDKVAAVLRSLANADAA
jgi:DNA-binding NarL/FixJ family response regulator